MASKLNLSGINAGTVARTAVLLLALTNQVLTACGKNILPIDDEELSTLISTGLTIVAALAAWWSNNSVTEHAQKADVYLEALRHGVPVPELNV